MRAPKVFLTATLTLAAFAGFSPGERDFDIEVFGLNVLATQDHTPVSSSLSTGQAGGSTTCSAAPEERDRRGEQHGLGPGGAPAVSETSSRNRRGDDR